MYTNHYFAKESSAMEAKVLNTSTEDDGEVEVANLLSKNERLMKEMNAFMASLVDSSDSLGTDDVTNCSGESKQTDPCSTSDDTFETLSRLFDGDVGAPPASASTPKENCSSVDDDAGDDTKKKTLDNNSLGPIDENGGELSPSQEYEYFDDATNSGGTNNNQFEEDSLVAMAKRMDAASIISDPSLNVGPNERGRVLPLPLPQPKMITAGVKKLGQKLLMPPSRPKSPARRRNSGARAKSPARNSTKQFNQQQQHPQTVPNLPGQPRRFSSSDNLMRSPSPASTMKDDNSSDFRASNHIKPFRSTNEKHSMSSGSTHSSERSSDGCDAREMKGSNSTEGPEARAAHTPQHKQRGRMSSRKGASTKYEDSKASGRVSEKKKKKGKKHKSRSRSKSRGKKVYLPPEERNSQSRSKSRCRVDGDVPTYLPDELLPTSAESSKNTKKKQPKSSKRESKKVKKKGSKGKKKWHQENVDDSSDEEIVGIGFNTRIHDKAGATHPGNQSADADADVPEVFSKAAPSQSSKAARRQSKEAKVAAPPVINTEVVGKRSENNTNNDDSDNNTEFFYESVTESEEEDELYSNDDNDSVYNSDDQTQIFYESTDDELTDSDDDLIAVGTSVEDAVRDLNTKSAVAKVKNLFRKG